MNRPPVAQFRRPGIIPPPRRRFPLAGRLGLLVLGTALLAAAFAGVAPLAYVALVPWLLAVSATRFRRGAFAFGWVGGIFFFAAVGWWIFRVDVAGGATLIAFLGLYWAVAALVLRGVSTLRTPPSAASMPDRWSTLLLVPTVWTAAEWLRGAWPWHGLPVVLMAYSQTPLLAVCQIADVTGPLGVSFVVVLVNTLVAMWVRNRLGVAGLVGPAVFVAAVVGCVVGYGSYRIKHEPAHFTAGPRVLVVQCNYRHDATGGNGVPVETLIRFHLQTTREALATAEPPDLIVWPETVMPPLNPEAVSAYGGVLAKTQRQLEWVAYSNRCSLLTGGVSWSDLHGDTAGRKTNCTYLFPADGKPFPGRYDKIDLVPFGEFVPFRTSAPWLYNLATRLSPPQAAGAMMTAGSEQNLTVYPIPVGQNTIGAVTPICFEDFDADLCARMFRPDTRAKRADVLINVTDDGWFGGGENRQHLQAAVFRSIENRVPTARAVNTGISGFIDPLGRVTASVPAATAGAASSNLTLDDRVTVFTRTGSKFGKSCGVLAAALAVIGLRRRDYRAPV